MSEPNNIWHLRSSPLTCKTTGYNSTTFPRSTTKRHGDDTITSRVAFAQQIHSTVSRETSVNVADATPEAGPCGFEWEFV